MSLAPPNVDVLRHGWEDTLTAVAPGMPALAGLLQGRLDAAVRDNRLDEESLLEIVQELAGLAKKSGGADTARLLSRGLQRAVYEYLLSLDAIMPEENDGLAPVRPVSADERTDLIGAEEVAQLEGHPQASLPVVEPHALDQPAAVQGQPTDKVPGLPAANQAMEAIELAESAEPAEPAREMGRRRIRFRLFRNGNDGVAESAEPQAVAQAPALEPDVAELEPEVPELEPEVPELDDEVPQPEPEAAAHELATEPEPEPEPEQAATPQPQAAAAEPAPQPQSDHDAPVRFVVAPREGFHLTEFEDLVAQPRSADEGVVTFLDDSAPAPDADAQAKHEEPPSPGWKVRRQGRHGEMEDVEPDIESDPLFSMLDADDSASRLRFENDPQVIEARSQINDKLRKRRCDDAAALLQKLSSEVGGRAVAELALDAGDRCRALGKANAALSCYLAASRADPVHEAALLRLADVCLDDKDIELAVSYLDRVARLHRLRGDTKGALRVYRKIATIAPFRDDILATLMRAQATGRFEE